MIGAPADNVSVTSLLLTYQRKLGGGLENVRQPNVTVCPTVAITDRGFSDHCGLSASVHVSVFYDIIKTRNPVVARLNRPYRLYPKASVRFLIPERKRFTRVSYATINASG